MLLAESLVPELEASLVVAQIQAELYNDIQFYGEESSASGREEENMAENEDNLRVEVEAQNSRAIDGEGEAENKEKASLQMEFEAEESSASGKEGESDAGKDRDIVLPMEAEEDEAKNEVRDFLLPLEFELEDRNSTPIG